MGKYPIDISEEDNAKLKYPFLPTKQYDSVHRLPDGPIIMFRGKPENIPKKCLEEAYRINQKIAARRILAEQDAAARNGAENV
jgi:hypothetical protein